MYKLVTIVATRQNISVDIQDGIDVRILLVSWPQSGQVDYHVEGTAGDDLTGPVINIRTLAGSRRPWTTIYTVETDPGIEVRKAFLSCTQAYTNIDSIRGGITAAPSAPSDAPQSTTESARKHYSVAVGGTFDHLHIGHKLLLTMFAFMIDEDPEQDSLTGPEKCLIVGITAGELLKNKKYADYLESWYERQQSTWDFLSAVMNLSRAGPGAIQTATIDVEGPNGHAIHYKLPSGLVVKLVEIWDPFGPTITDESISALVISAETRSGGKAVNEKRKDRGWPELDVFEVDVLDAEEGELRGEVADQQFQSKLSSTEIRRIQSEKSRKGSKV